ATGLVSATLGFHLLPGSDRAAVTRAATGMPVVKVCDADAIGPARAAGCPFVYYRPYLPDDGDCADGADWGTRVWRPCRRRATPSRRRSASAMSARPVPRRR